MSKPQCTCKFLIKYTFKIFEYSNSSLQAVSMVVSMKCFATSKENISVNKYTIFQSNKNVDFSLLQISPFSFQTKHLQSSLDNSFLMARKNYSLPAAT